MKRNYIKNLKQGKCKICGYVETIRDKKLIFLVVKDVTGFVQVTINKEKNKEIYNQAKKLTAHSFIEIEGECVFSEFVKNGGKEIYPTKLVIHSIAEPLPITQDSAQDLRLDYRWIDLRNTKKIFAFKVQTTAEIAMQKFFASHNFMSLHTPHITAFSSEGGSEVFEIKNYFGQKAYLTQSSQLFKQCAMASGFERTYEIGPCFRANKSFTNRHDTEFIQIDAEISFINSHHDVMDIEEEFVKFFCNEIEKKHSTEIQELFGIKFTAPTIKFPRISLLEAYELLKKEKGYEVPKSIKGDLDPEGESLICEIVKEKYGSEFVFITDFPASARAFYSMKHEHNPNLTKSFDLLYKGQEITSGAQREHRADILRKQIAEKGIDPKKMEFYIQFFEYGCPPHGGFGFGLTRFLTKVFDFPSVKEVTFLFRGPTRLKP